MPFRSVRLSLLETNALKNWDEAGQFQSAGARLSLPGTNALPEGDANIGIVCATCHNPHQTNGNPAQLRNPVASTNDYFMPTNGAFASYYNPGINLCGQCHNSAGASWTNNESEPHHSTYNKLIAHRRRGGFRVVLLPAGSARAGNHQPVCRMPYADNTLCERCPAGRHGPQL